MNLIYKMKGLGRKLLFGAGMTILSTASAKAEEPKAKPGHVLRLECSNPRKAGISLEFNLDRNLGEAAGEGNVHVHYPSRAEENFQFLPKGSGQEDGSELINLEEHVKNLDDYNRKSFDAKKWVIEIPAYALAGYFTKLLWHELGHVRTAAYFGAEEIGIHFFDKKIGAAAFVSYAVPADMSSHEQNLVSAAGCEATTTASFVLYNMLKHNAVPEKLKPFVAVTSLLMLLDRHQYLTGTAFLNYTKRQIHEGNDFDNIIRRAFGEFKGIYVDGHDFRYNGQMLKNGNYYMDDGKGSYKELQIYADKEGKWREMADRNNYVNVIKGRCVNDKSVTYDCNKWAYPKDSRLQQTRDMVYGIAVGMSALELGLRWKEINYLFNAAIGKNPKAPEGFEVLKAGVYPLPGGFITSIDGAW